MSPDRPATQSAASHPSPRRPVLRALFRLFAGVLVAGWVAAAGGGAGVDEYQLKAAFLNKFVKYVSWPAERQQERAGPLVVAVFGQDPFGARLDDVFKSRRQDERPVVVRRLRALEDLKGAHVLFVPAREAARLNEILDATRGAGVLLVGESTDFAAHGAAINFYLEGDKLRFEVNTEAAKRQGLKLSSDLLKLARIVEDKR